MSKALPKSGSALTLCKDSNGRLGPARPETIGEHLMRTLPTLVIGSVLCCLPITVRAAVDIQDQGYIGVGIRPLDDNTAERLGLPRGNGEVVERIQPQAPADRVGIRQGDVIVEVNGQEVTPDRTLAMLISSSPPGAKITLRLFRDGQYRTVTPKLSRRPPEEQLASRSPETPESRAQSYIDEARATIAANNVRLNDKSVACDSTEASEGGRKIARVDGLMQGLVNIQPRFPPYMQSGVSRAIANLGVEAGRLRLEQADGFLSAGCNSQADRLYRFVLSNFSSPSFEGLRQRAQVGIDDVRARGQ